MEHWFESAVFMVRKKIFQTIKEFFQNSFQIYMRSTNDTSPNSLYYKCIGNNNYFNLIGSFLNIYPNLMMNMMVSKKCRIVGLISLLNEFEWFFDTSCRLQWRQNNRNPHTNHILYHQIHKYPHSSNSCRWHFNMMLLNGFVINVC